MYYTVQSGDSLHSIAVAYNTTISNLMDLNSQISNPNQIYPGERIKVSSGSKWTKKSKSWKKTSATSNKHQHHGHGW